MADEVKDETVENKEGDNSNTPEFTVKIADEVESDKVPEQKEPENKEEPEKKEEEKLSSEKENFEDKKDPEEEFDVIELTDETAFEFLKKSKGFDAESFDDLIKSKDTRKLTPEIEKFMEFKEKTGNSSYSDFLATQKEWDKEEPTTVLKHLLKVENPTLDDKQIDFLFKKKYSYDEEFVDEDEKMEKEINKKVDLQKGLAFFEKQKQDYMVERGSDDNLIPDEYKNAKKTVDELEIEISNNQRIAAQKRSEFESVTESLFTDSFEGFKTKIGDEETVIKPSDIKKTKETQLDIRNIQAKFFDENEKLIDPVGYHKALYFAYNADDVAKHYFNLGKASMAEQEEKDSKNIPDKNGIREVNRPIGDKQFTVKVVE